MSVYFSVLLCTKQDVTTEQLVRNNRQIDEHVQIVDSYHDDWIEIFGSYNELSFRMPMEGLLGVKLESEGGSVGEAFPSTEPDFEAKVLAAMIRINKELVALNSKGQARTHVDDRNLEAYTRLNTLLGYMGEQVSAGNHVVLRWA